MKNNLPLVTVVVPSYNHEKFVQQSIESIYSQTYKNFELIVIDDGSKDSSVTILQQLSESYGFYFEHQENMGLARTLNKAILLAKGTYITFLASDDLMLPNKIESLLMAMEQLDNSYAIVSGNAKFLNDEGSMIVLEKHGKKFSTFIDYYVFNRKDIDLNNNFGTYSTLLSGNYLPATSTLFRKVALVSVGLFTEDIPIEDWDIYLKLSKKYRMKYIDKVVSLYRWHETNTIKTNILGLNIGVLKILKRERTYAIKNKYYNLWLKKYAGCLMLLARSKKYILILQYLHFNDLYSLTIYFIKNLKKETIQTFMSSNYNAPKFLDDHFSHDLSDSIQ